MGLHACGHRRIHTVTKFITPMFHHVAEFTCVEEKKWKFVLIK